MRSPPLLITATFILAAGSDGLQRSKDLCPGNETLATTRALHAKTVRRKRSLTFPKGSAFVMTMTLLKAIQIREPTNWNLDLELDMIWPIPEGVNVRKPMPVQGRPMSHPHRRQRRELYANFQLGLDSQGMPGNLCVLRTICESKFILNPPGVSLVEDVLRVVFTYPGSGTSRRPDAYDKAHLTKEECDASYPCPFSLLDLLLNYRNDVSEYK